MLLKTSDLNISSATQILPSILMFEGIAKSPTELVDVIFIGEVP